MTIFGAADVRLAAYQRYCQPRARRRVCAIMASENAGLEDRRRRASGIVRCEFWERLSKLSHRSYCRHPTLR